MELVQVQNHKRNHEFELKNHTHTQELIQQSTATIIAILERTESLGASASQWRRDNTPPAEIVHSLQNKPPEPSSAPNHPQSPSPVVDYWFDRLGLSLDPVLLENPSNIPPFGFPLLDDINQHVSPLIFTRCHTTFFLRICACHGKVS